MNVITFNEHIEKMTLGRNGESLDRCFPSWRTAPLFDYATTYEREHDIIQKNKHFDAFAVTPFPVFRFNVTAQETAHPEWGKYRAKALVRHVAGYTHVFARVDALMETAETYLLPKTPEAMSEGLPLYLFITKMRYEGATDEGPIYAYDHLFGMYGTWLNARQVESIQGLVTSYLDGFLKSLGTFLIDCMSPGVHIAQVYPAKEHKSVQWQQARTHYTLILHGHPANKKSVSEGERVTVDQAGELTRMAHNRRSHYKLLKHERYRFARGKRVFVRAAWVGPKEWKDQGGQQIYKILEPVNGTSGEFTVS